MPWPRPVSASEPNSSQRTRCTRSRMPGSSSQRWPKRAAARIGPTVCEDDGPMPILKRSKTLTAMSAKMGARGTLFYAPAHPRRRMRLVLYQRDDCKLCDEALARARCCARAGLRQRLHRRRCRARSALRRAHPGLARRGERARARLAVRCGRCARVSSAPAEPAPTEQAPSEQRYSSDEACSSTALQACCVRLLSRLPILVMSSRLAVAANQVCPARRSRSRCRAARRPLRRLWR